MAMTETGDPVLLQALEKALGELGPSTKHALPYHLQKMYRVDSAAKLTLNQIESGLSDIFGSATILILDRLYAELNKTRAQK